MYVCIYLCIYLWKIKYCLLFFRLLSCWLRGTLKNYQSDDGFQPKPVTGWCFPLSVVLVLCRRLQDLLVLFTSLLVY